MTPDEVRGILRGVGLCDDSDGKSACLLHKDHLGRHGFQSASPQCESVESSAMPDPKLHPLGRR